MVTAGLGAVEKKKLTAMVERKQRGGVRSSKLGWVWPEREKKERTSTKGRERRVDREKKRRERERGREEEG